MLQILIALKNSSSLAGYEPTNLGSNGKYANQYTTENEWCDDALLIVSRSAEHQVPCAFLCALIFKIIKVQYKNSELEQLKRPNPKHRIII
jgi:hypothetical protein